MRSKCCLAFQWQLLSRRMTPLKHAKKLTSLLMIMPSSAGAPLRGEIEIGYVLASSTLFFLSHNHTDLIVLSCAVDPI